MGVPCRPARRSSSSPLFPPISCTSAVAPTPPGPAQCTSSPHQCPSSSHPCTFVLCGSCPSVHLVRHLHIHIPSSNTTRHRLPLPCPPHNIPSPAYIVRRVIRFPSFRFARTLPSPLAHIHRIPYTFSPNPEPQARARCACRGGCDRVIAFFTVRQLQDHLLTPATPFLVRRPPSPLAPPHSKPQDCLHTHQHPPQSSFITHNPSLLAPLIAPGAIR